MPDSAVAKFGTGSDMQLYHDGTNSYVANSAGELRLATLTSGIAIAIGHSTSEVTFGDNVTVTGDFTVNGTTTTVATTNLTVTDPLVKFGQDYVGSAYDQGFIVTRGNGSASNTANKGFIWDESADEFAAVAANTEDGTTAGNVTINSYADMQVAKLTGASLDISGDIDVDGTTNLDAVDIDGAVQLDATLTVGANDQGYDVILYGDTASANMTWDTSADDLIFNGAAGLIVPDGQLTLGSTAITSTAAEINLIDGGTARGTTAVASGDGILINDAGTMRMTNVDTVSTYFAGHSVGGGNIVTTGALDSGSITSGFGNIDNGASNITNGGLVHLDVDSDADDITGDSATGRLAIGAGQDLNLYHGGTHSYIVNDTGNLVINTGASDADIAFSGNDGGAAITALTLDMSAAGAATFNDKITAVGTSVFTNLDISGDVDVDGTLETDALTVGGVAAKVAGKETIYVPATAMYPSTTNGCATLAQVETTALRPDLMALDFATGADEFAQFSIAFPKSWNEGTVTFQPYWTVTGTNTGTVAWGLSGIAVSSDDSINTAFGTTVVCTALAHSGTSNDLMMSVESGAVTIAGSPAAEDMCFFQVSRDVSADAQSGDARLLGIKVFFTTDAANDA
jgi:cytoskeletal protein CcmA (bactofilin family)